MLLGPKCVKSSGLSALFPGALFAGLKTREKPAQWRFQRFSFSLIHAKTYIQTRNPQFIQLSNCIRTFYSIRNLLIFFPLILDRCFVLRKFEPSELQKFPLKSWIPSKYFAPDDVFSFYFLDIVCCFLTAGEVTAMGPKIGPRGTERQEGRHLFLFSWIASSLILNCLLLPKFRNNLYPAVEFDSALSPFTARMWRRVDPQAWRLATSGPGGGMGAVWNGQPGKFETFQMKKDRICDA